MSKVTIQNLGKTIEVTDTTRPLLATLHHYCIDWMHACGGKGRCTTCKAIVLDGQQNLSEPSPAERSYMEKKLLKPGERLVCQTFVIGDVLILVPEEGKLPHQQYLDE